MPKQHNQSTEHTNAPSTEIPYGLNEETIRQAIKAIDEKNTTQLQAFIKEHHAADVADFIDLITHEQRRIFVKMVGATINPEIFLNLHSDVREELLGLLGNDESAAVITQLDVEDAVQVIEDLDESEQQEILEAIPLEQREELEEGLSYPEDSAGRLMSKHIVAVPQFWTVGQTIDFLRKEEGLPEDFLEIYVVDPSFKPVGAVRISKIMRNKRSIVINDIMYTDIRTVSVNMDQEEVAFMFRQYGLVSSPVLRNDGRLVGYISMDDIVHVMQEEAEEDIMRMGGISETDLHSFVSETAKRRFPWLVVNLITAILASVVIGVFSDTIEQVVALAVLMPIVASMGGNAGTQTVTVAVRAIATKELTTTNALRVIAKETFVGSINGLLFAIIMAIVVQCWYGDIMLSIIFGVATILTLILAGMTGAAIPLILVKLGADPAIASTVFLTTVTDVAAFAIFLGFATLILI